MKRWWLAPIVLGALILGSSTVQAEDRIVFLRVRFDSAGVTLESTSVVSGTLKTGGHGIANGDRVTLRVLGQNSTVLHSEAMDDPRFVVRETFNEDGTVGRVVEERPSAVTVIRFPFDARATRVEFTLPRDASAASRARPLGSVQLDLSEHEKK